MPSKSYLMNPIIFHITFSQLTRQNSLKYVTAESFAFLRSIGAYHSHFLRVNPSIIPETPQIRKKTLSSSVFFNKMADREGFEPSIPFRGIHDFQSCALGHSAIYPYSVTSHDNFRIYAYINRYFIFSKHFFANMKKYCLQTQFCTLCDCFPKIRWTSFFEHNILSYMFSI